MSAVDKIISQLPIGKEAASKKEQYIELISELLERCTDIDTLDLVYRILAKNI